MKIKNEKEIFDLYVEDEYALRDTLKTPFGILLETKHSFSGI